MKSVFQIEAQRLVARPFQPNDFELLRQLLQNPQVAATLGGVPSDQEVREILARTLDHWQGHGFGRWIWHDKSDDRFVGRGGLLNVLIDGRHEVEVGYALLPEFWNEGLATEIAQASVNAAFNNLGLSEVVSFTLPTNRASRRVMEKCGLTFERDFVWKDLPHVLYRLKR